MPSDIAAYCHTYDKYANIANMEIYPNLANKANMPNESVRLALHQLPVSG